MINKEKKRRSAALMTALYMIVGGIFGAGSMFLFMSFKDSGASHWFIRGFDFFIVNIVYAQIALGLIMQLPALYFFKKGKTLIETATYSSDEEEDQFEEHFDQALNRALILNSTHMVLGFILFGIAIDERNSLIWASIGIFLFLMILEIIVEYGILGLLKKRNPIKDVDPTSLKFEKEWIEVCDEAERMMIYKASYRTFSNMKIVLLFAFIITFFTKPVFGTGNFPLVLLGLVWLAHNSLYYFNTMQFKKDKINA